MHNNWYPHLPGNCILLTVNRQLITNTGDTRQFKTLFFFNNQADVLIIHIYSVIKIYVSGIFFAHHQEFSSVYSALVSFMQVMMTGSGQHNMHETYQCRMYSRKLLMMGKEVAPKHVHFYDRINLDN